jgi:hypothetical protein
MLRSLIASPVTSGVGHWAGGTTYGMLNGLSFSEASNNAFDGIGNSMVVGTAIGLGATYISSKANGIDPWSGKALNKPFIVTPDGVALPKGAYIPDDLIENPNRSGSYGNIIDGKFVETIRIDPGTTPGANGPNKSHFHLNGGREHIFDINRWPWWH